MTSRCTTKFTLNDLQLSPTVAASWLSMLESSDRPGAWRAEQVSLSVDRVIGSLALMEGRLLSKRSQRTHDLRLMQLRVNYAHVGDRTWDLKQGETKIRFSPGSVAESLGIDDRKLASIVRVIAAQEQRLKCGTLKGVEIHVEVEATLLQVTIEFHRRCRVEGCSLMPHKGSCGDALLHDPRWMQRVLRQSSAGATPHHADELQDFEDADTVEQDIPTLEELEADLNESDSPPPCHRDDSVSSNASHQWRESKHGKREVREWETSASESNDCKSSSADDNQVPSPKRLKCDAFTSIDLTNEHLAWNGFFDDDVFNNFA
mmetsp:Transcript_42443/g.68909  ORF Transcript_42443/g.68909 Transcript_42443/m.68909 type:complete len:318 (-) Transcript_42443:19-972(-)